MRLTLLLAPQDGGTAWRQLLAPDEARAGWEQVGPLGLARRLGRILGYPAAAAPAPDRIAAWSTRLQVHDDGSRAWSASRKADPTGVAAFLLSLRDRLRMAGWRGGPLDASDRLLDLSAVEALRDPPLPSGQADLLETLRAAIADAGRLPLALDLRLTAPRAAYPPRLRDLLDALVRAGATVADVPPDAALAPPRSDLGKLQRALLDPSAPRAALAGDGTLLLLEADTPIEAGELAAGLLRTWPLAATTAVVAAGQEPLDAALFRQGLPTLGLGSASPLRPHAQFLPLRLALAFRPRDPFRAAELLSLPGAPLPGWTRRKLLAALGEMPGIDSPAWRAAVDEAVRETEARDGAEPGAGRALRERIDDWFGRGPGDEHDPREGIPPARAAALCAMVATWAGVRAGRAEQDGDGREAGLWAHSAATALTLQRNLVALPPGDPLSQLALGQLHDVAVGAGPDAAPFAAEAGRPAVCAAPGDVLPGSGAVLWFGFVQDVAPGAAPEPWTDAERAALAAAGLSVSAPGEDREVEAWGWRRPLLLARERAALVRWRLDGAEAVASHALLDELATRTAPGALAACTRSSERLLSGGPGSALLPGLATAAVVPAPPIAPHPVWTVPPATLVPRGTLSPTAVETLLGCPFRWALERQADLRPGRALDLPEGSRLLGTFAHALLQGMLLGPSKLDLARATPAEASAWALAAFDARVGTEAAPLLRPGNEVERDAARTLVSHAAGELVRQLLASGWIPEAAEQEVTGTFAGQPIHGYVDLVLRRGAERALLDLKLSGGKYRRAELAQGLGIQIALYSSMLRGGGGDYPPAGFFILADADLLTVNAAAFPEATPVDGPGAHETVQEAERRFLAWRGVLAKGALPLCSDDLPWGGPVDAAGGPEQDDTGTALRDTACRFCRYQTICHSRVGEEVAP